MSIDSPPPAQTPRGWYADPHTAGQDRWWDGAAWTDFTHRSASVRRTLFGETYTRAWWPGPNVAAGRGLLLGRIGFLGLLLELIAALFAGAAGMRSPGIAIAILMVDVISAVLFVIALVLGTVGVRRARALDGMLPAAWGIGLAIIGLLIAGGALFAVWLVATLH